MPKFYVGPVGLEYNDEGYDSTEEAISSVLGVYDTHQQAQVAVDALTVAAVRQDHYVYEYMTDEWADEGFMVGAVSDAELLEKLDEYADYTGQVPNRLYGIIS